MFVRCLVLILLALNAALAQAVACTCVEGQICAFVQGVSKCFDRTVCPAQCQDNNCIIQYTETGGIQASCNCGAGTWDPNTQRCRNGCPTCGLNQFCSVDQQTGRSSCQCLDGFQYDIQTGECTNDGIFLPCETRTNPCVNPNQECVNSQCQCKRGFTWDFVTRQCKPELVTVGNKAWCGSLGDPHYTTFDSVYYDYQGYCDHVFVRTPTFEVHSRNGNCFGSGWSGVTCTIGAAGRVGSVTFEFTQDRVIANGALVNTFPSTIGPVTFGNSGGFTASFDGVIVSFSGFSLRVEVPNTYVNETSGLCGVFNYDPTDDFTMRSGLTTADSQTFAPDWQVIAGVDPILFFTQCPQAGNSTNGGSCWDQTYLLNIFRKCQDIIETTGNCNFYTDLSQAFKACVVDLCNIPIDNPNLPQITQTIVRDYIQRIYEGCDTEAPCARCNPTEVCDENKRCVCPIGTTRDPLSNKCIRNGGVDGTCQTDNNCPPHQHCVLVGTNIGRCQCDDGYVFNFTTNQCEPALSTSPTTVICTGSGDPHYTTADGLYYDFQGRCDFVLWRGNGLEIQVRNSECSPTNPRPTVSCTEGVAFLAGTAVIRFDMTGAYVNNNPITTFPSTINGVVLENGSGFKATFASGAVITFMNWWVSVSVPSSFKTRMNGLCGYYDDVQSNDPRARDGVVRPIPDFAASWRVDSAVDPILFPQETCTMFPNGTGPTDGLDCDRNDADRRAAMDHCQRLLDVAADCQNFEDVSTAYLSCIRDFCALATHSITIDVVTTQIEAYRARCEVKQGDNDSYCGVCPDNSGCITDATGAKRCVCNSGFILNPTTGRCDPRDDTPAQPCDPTAANPCRENEYCEGNLNTPICKCVDGYYFNPNTRVCTPINNPPTSNRVVCSSSGDPHYATFDGSYYDYMGTCDHVLTQGNGLIVHTRNGDCSPYSIPPTISCTRAVAFKLGTDIIEFGADGLIINNVVSVAPQNVNGIVIVQTSGGYTATLPDTSVISYSSLSVWVSLPRAPYINKMHGLCGFFDGDATNDYTSRAGAISPVYPFATSWLVSAAAGDPILFHDQCVHVGNNESTPIDCTGAIHDRAVEICKGLLNVDDRCAQIIGLDVIIRNCIFDICAGFPVNVEEILRLIKEKCGDNATDPCANCGPNEECVTVTLSDGRTVKSCRCKEGFVLDPATKKCVDNIAAAPCRGGSTAPPCPPNMICREGICVCDRGFVTDDAGSCVPQTQYNNTWADCVIMGDPHYDTFDGVFYDYQNPCDTVLVYSPVNNFYVHGRNGQCWRQWPNTQVSCLMGIAFNQPGTSNKIELFPEGVYVNGVLQVLSSFPLTLGTGAVAVTIVMTNSFPGVDNVVVYSWNATFVDGTSVLYNSYFNGQVTVPNKFLRKTTGMCGTWNFTTAEDFTKRDGSLAANSVDFGDDWKVQPSDIQLFSTPNADCTNARSIGTPRQVGGAFDCSVQQFLDIAFESCRRLFNVARCRNAVDVTPYFRACVADYCSLSETGEILTNTSVLSYLNRCNSLTRTSNVGGTSTGTNTNTNTQGTSTGSNTNTGTPTSTSGSSGAEQSSSLAPVVQFSVALIAIVLAMV